MDKIICLVGESGSGKSTIAELLRKEYNVIDSYTTRKKRFEEETGHIFVTRTSKEAINVIDTHGDICGALPIVPVHEYWISNKVIAYTFFDGNHYWATREQYKGKGTSIYVIDVEGVKKLRENVKDAEIVVIYLRCDEAERRDRMYDREVAKDVDRFESINKAINRIDHDREAFKIVPCNYSIDSSRPVEEVLEDVKKIIEGEE